jgi:hypothetical protein
LIFALALHHRWTPRCQNASAIIPRPRTLLWTLALAVVLGFPVTSWVYWPAVLRSHVLPPDADTILIPMVRSILVAVVAAPAVLVVTHIATHRLPAEVNALAWDAARPVSSLLVTAGFGSLALIAARLVIAEVAAPPEWHGWLWLPYTLAAIAWLLATRAAALSPTSLRKGLPR